MSDNLNSKPKRNDYKPPPPWLEAIYRETGRKYGVPAEVLMAQGFHESGYRKEARSLSGAVGPAQFLEGTARHYGLKVGGGVDERTDFPKAIDAQARYMRDLLKKFDGNLEYALAGYNMGENGLAKRLAQGQPVPSGPKAYAQKIMRDGHWNPEQKVNVQELRYPEPAKRKGPVSELTPTQPTTPEFSMPAPTRVVARMGR